MTGGPRPDRQRPDRIALAQLLGLVARLSREALAADVPHRAQHVDRRTGFALVDRLDLEALGAAHRRYESALAGSPDEDDDIDAGPRGP